jgi:uncharacterized protein (UPF0332 family)
MDEVKITFKRALKLLKVAESNLNNEYFLDSINRSYYAVFYVIGALLLKKGIITKTHSGAIRQFGFEYVLNGVFNKEISGILSELEEDRKNADYDALFKSTKNKAINDLKKLKNS